MNREELERLSKFKEQICRNNCEEYGTCDDCYIEFEDVQAVEKLLNNYNNLIKYLEDKIKDYYLKGVADGEDYDAGYNVCCEEILERVKSGNYE